LLFFDPLPTLCNLREQIVSDTTPLAGIYKLEQAERKQQLAAYVGLTDDDLAVLEAGLSAEQAEVM
jgi:hypothetical protein